MVAVLRQEKEIIKLPFPNYEPIIKREYNIPIKLKKEEVKKEEIIVNYPLRRHLTFFLMFIIICSIGLYFHTVLIENYLSKKEKQIIKIKENIFELKVTLSSLKTPAIIEEKAKEMKMKSVVNNINYLIIPSHIYNSVMNPKKQKNLLVKENKKIPAIIGY